jgi:pimeloyl-ACP methyl ester carboxylesterase
MPSSRLLAWLSSGLLAAAVPLAARSAVPPHAPLAVRVESSPTRWHWIRVHGHLMYYVAEGTGRPVVLLHGGGDSGEHSFEQQIELLAQHHHIIAPDQVGQGHTPDVPGPLSYTHMMEDTVAVIRMLGSRSVDVVGFSDGGIIALMLAARYPQLVRRMAISGVNISPEGLTDEQREELRASQAPEPKSIDEKLAQLWLTSPTKDELSLQILSTIHKPVLVISGDRDAIRLEHTLEIYRALPDAELCILPGTDHGTFSGRPEWLNPILTDFLDRPDGH